jgi:GT2 family glycosyltransferase
MNISMLVGLKNNLELAKYFYKTTRQVYPEQEIVFVSYGSSDGTHAWLDSLDDPHVQTFHSPESKALADSYNKALELASKEYVVFLHNDMVLGPGFLENITKKLAPDVVVGFSVIEPTLYAADQRSGKTTKAFGTNIGEFQLQEFYSFVQRQQSVYAGVTSERIEFLFFIALSRQKLLEVGGLDNLFFPMFREDDDLFLRLTRAGLKPLLVHDAICYHFVSQTSRYSEEYRRKSKEIERNSERNFVRKWGFPTFNARTSVFDIGIVLRNVTTEVLRAVEPFASDLYIDGDSSEYVAEEQAKTQFDLKKKIHSLATKPKNDVLVQIDARQFGSEELDVVTHTVSTILKRERRLKLLRAGWLFSLLGRRFAFQRKRVKIFIQRMNLRELLPVCERVRDFKGIFN